MTYPLAHKINMRHPYTRAVDTDIRKTFERFKHAEISNLPVVDADLIPAGTAQRPDQDKCSY